MGSYHLALLGGHAFTKKFSNKHESILWFVKPGEQPKFFIDSIREKAKEYDKRNNFWGRNPGNVWEVDRVAFGSTEQTSHIAVFPEELSERIVRACSEPDDLVLDPFAGSGTVSKVARGLGRRWIGIDISSLYASHAAMRVGFQQPNEEDSLASELVKRFAFFGRRATLETSEIPKRVQFWIATVPTEKLWREFEKDVEAVFSDGRGRNLTKRDVWIKYDLMFEHSNVGDPIVIVDELLCKCYKLRQQFNGVTRFKSALTTLDNVKANFSDSILAVQYVKKIASQEPSSFGLGDTDITLLLPTRRLIHKETDAVDPDFTPGHTGEDTLQGRLLL